MADHAGGSAVFQFPQGVVAEVPGSGSHENVTEELRLGRHRHRLTEWTAAGGAQAGGGSGHRPGQVRWWISIACVSTFAAHASWRCLVTRTPMWCRWPAGRGAQGHLEGACGSAWDGCAAKGCGNRDGAAVAVTARKDDVPAAAAPKH